METKTNCSKEIAPQRPYMYVSQTLAGWNHLYSETGHKQAQDPPGSLHTIVSLVEWSAPKGRSPQWFTIRKMTCFTNMLHTYMSVSPTASSVKCEFTPNQKQVINRLKIPQGLSTLLFRRWSEVPSRGGVHGDTVKKMTCFTKTPHTASGRVNSLVIGNRS